LPDKSSASADTVVGFNDGPNDLGSLIIDPANTALAHSALVNSGGDTPIMLGDGSTILLKGVSHLDPGFFG